jgi:hypothetical protein
MNRYVCIATIYQSPYQVVREILDTDEGIPTTSPYGNSSLWLDVTGNTTVQLDWIALYTLRDNVFGWFFDEPTPEQYVKFTTCRMQERFDELARRLMFNPLQYKVDLGIATAADQAALVEYKQYAIAVSEVKSQPGYPVTINWPVAPY